MPGKIGITGWIVAFAALSLLAGCGGNSGPVVVDESYAADRVVIRDFIGTLVIETSDEGGEVNLHLEATQAQLDLLPIRLSGDTLNIEWEGEPDRRRAWYEFWRGRWMVDLNRLDQYPTLVLTVPVDIEIEVDAIIGRWTVEDRAGRLIFAAESGSGTIGATEMAEISITGDADLEIGSVAERLEIAVTGSGTVVGTEATRAELSVAGSGELSLGNIAGGLVVNVSGSGKVVIGDADSASVSVSGSGSVRLGSVAEGLRAGVEGSGAVLAVLVNGAFDATVTGSGRIEVGDGRASPFAAVIAGSGSVRFWGTAVDPVATLSGSGSVFLGVVEGELTSRTSGAGRVQVGR